MITKKALVLILSCFVFFCYAQNESKSVHTVFKITKLPPLVIEFTELNVKAQANTIKKSNIANAELRIQTDGCIWYEIVSYDVTGNVNGKPKVASYRSISSKYRYTEEMGKLSKEVVVGNSILVDNIKIKDFNGKTRSMPAMKIKITPG